MGALIQLDDVQGDYAEGRDDGYLDGFADGREAGVKVGMAMGQADATERAVAYFEQVAAETQDKSPFGKAFWCKQAALALRMNCHARGAQ